MNLKAYDGSPQAAAARQRRREALGKGLINAAITAMILLFFWWALPDWLVRPYKEASANEYSQVGAIINGYDSDRCPAVRLYAVKALQDGKLTKGEVDDLRSKVEEAGELAKIRGAKAEALQAVGRRPTEALIDCPYPSLVFL